MATQSQQCACNGEGIGWLQVSVPTTMLMLVIYFAWACVALPRPIGLGRIPSPNSKLEFLPRFLTYLGNLATDTA